MITCVVMIVNWALFSTQAKWTISWLTKTSGNFIKSFCLLSQGVSCFIHTKNSALYFAYFKYLILSFYYLHRSMSMCERVHMSAVTERQGSVRVPGADVTVSC